MKLLEKIGRPLLLAVFVFLVCLAIAELVLRGLGMKQPELLPDSPNAHNGQGPDGAPSFTYRGHLPGSFIDFSNEVTLNSHGFHDVEHVLKREDYEVFRLLIVGDSYVAALSVPLEDTFFRQLQAALNTRNPLRRKAYEVIAMGRGNQAQARELEYIKSYGNLIQPDAVLLLFFCGNDFMENGPATFRNAARFATRYKREVAPAKAAFFKKCLLFPRSRLNGLIAEAATTFYAAHLHWFNKNITADDLISPELGVYHHPLSKKWESAFIHTARLLSEMKQTVEQTGAKFLIAGLTGPQAIGDAGPALVRAAKNRKNLVLTQPETWLAEWCANNSVPYCPLAPVLKKTGKHAYWPHDGHLNKLGNQVVVAPLYEFVIHECDM